MESRREHEGTGEGGSEPPAESGGVRAPDASAGEDRSLIRWMLALSPLERLDVLQNQARALLALRNGRG